MSSVRIPALATGGSLIRLNTPMKRIVDSRAYVVFVLCATTAIALRTQSFTTLHSFDGTDGANPVTPVVQAADASLSGTTLSRGAYGHGTIFKITTKGTLSTPHRFCSQVGCPDGAEPDGLMLGANGDLYGTSYYGGANHVGTIFQIT